MPLRLPTCRTVAAASMLALGACATPHSSGQPLEAAANSIRDAEVAAVRRRGEEYLLERHLFRRQSTGDVVDPDWLKFSFPVRWRFDVLRGLDYFRSVGGTPDPRLEEAIALVRSKQQPDGTWLLENTPPGKVYFTLEAGDGLPSRWNTLRALRVLEWYYQ